MSSVADDGSFTPNPAYEEARVSTIERLRHLRVLGDNEEGYLVIPEEVLAHLEGSTVDSDDSSSDSGSEADTPPGADDEFGILPAGGDEFQMFPNDENFYIDGAGNFYENGSGRLQFTGPNKSPDQFTCPQCEVCRHRRRRMPGVNRCDYCRDSVPEEHRLAFFHVCLTERPRHAPQ